MKKIKYLIVKLGNKPIPHLNLQPRPTLYPLPGLDSERSTPTAKMAEEEDYSSIPLPDRFTHKVRCAYDSFCPASHRNATDH